MSALRALGSKTAAAIRPEAVTQAIWLVSALHQKRTYERYLAGRESECRFASDENRQPEIKEKLIPGGQ